MYGERPFFEKEGCPPHQDDPYTVESARSTLCQLIEKLAAMVDCSVNDSHTRHENRAPHNR